LRECRCHRSARILEQETNEEKETTKESNTHQMQQKTAQGIHENRKAQSNFGKPGSPTAMRNASLDLLMFSPDAKIR